VRIELATGPDAVRLLADPAFRDQWRALYDACPWGTPFQSPEFVTTWYDVYASRFTPVVLYSMDGDSLAGLLTLGRSPESGALCAAGADRAEYQAWLARPASGEAFITNALTRRRAAFPDGLLTMCYLPPGTPIEWATRDRRWRRMCRLETLQAPLMNLEQGAHASASRWKKVARSVGRLERRGTVRFDQLTAVSELEAVLDDIATQYDLRQGAANDYTHFGSDPLRKAFLLALMRAGVLHATVLRHDEAFVAANLGVSGKDIVYLGIFAHSAHYAKESPGKLHLALLGGHLAKANCRTLDLTPGEDTYKPAFANGAADVYELTVFSSSLARHLGVVGRQTSKWAKQRMQAVGVDTLELKKEAKRAWRAGVRRSLATSIRSVCRHAFSREELRVYALPAVRIAAPNGEPVARRDAYADLLAYEPIPDLYTRQEFLSRALTRVQHGHHVYTRVEEGRLVHCGWLAENQERAVLSEVDQSLTLPSRSAVLYDFHTHPHARGRGLYHATLRQMLRETVASGGTDWIFIWVQAKNASSRHVIEKAGFEYRGSVFQTVTLGHVRRWSTIDDCTEKDSTEKQDIALSVRTSIRQGLL
jgi:CelD/BcsL family acetyltransferase involved in cellulose biosynthesis/GNAT superfamily N-acetyltransferase